MRRLTPVLALLIPLAGCSDTPSQAPDRIVAEVKVTLAVTQLPAGASTRATAVVRDDYDQVITNIPVTWSSSSPTTASVSEDGLVTTILTGNVTIVAKAGGRQGSASLLVTRGPPPAVASVELLLSVDSLQWIGATRARAVVRDASGAVVQRAVTWSSSNSNVVSVTNSGWVTARRGGEAIIVAEIDGKADSVTIPLPHVTQLTVDVEERVRVGHQYFFSATPQLADGRTVNRQVQWTSLDVTRGTVTPDGRFTALALGPVLLRATAEDVVVDVTVNGYGWETQQTATGFLATLPSQNSAVDASGNTVYATLIVGCENAMPVFRVDLPLTVTGKVTHPFYFTGWGEEIIEEWPTTTSGVTMPAVEQSEFRDFMTAMEQGYVAMYFERPGTWTYFGFYTDDIRTVLAPAVAGCPALGT